MLDKQLFSFYEQVKDDDYVIASYFIELDPRENVMEKVSSFAVGQTLGTWLPVPGINEAMREKHMGKVINVYSVPPYDLVREDETGKRAYIIQLAFPTINFGAQFPMLLTTLLGNDASTSAQVKLIDLQLPERYVSEFNGPNFGMKGIREITGVYDRPLILNMIKPCTGITPDIGAKIFYETALGGVDLIKDDELLANPSFNNVASRIKKYKEAANQAYEKTGTRTKYVANITDSVDKIFSHAEHAQDLGVDAIMVNFAAVGYSTLHSLAKKVKVPILGHYASAGMLYEGLSSGLSSQLAVGRFPRLAGADMVVINTPYGNYPLSHQKYFETVKELSLPYYSKKSVMPAVGGGVHPGMVPKYVNELGIDIIMAVGGAIQGHPDGASAGGKAMRQGIELVIKEGSYNNIPDHMNELKKAVENWGIKQ